METFFLPPGLKTQLQDYARKHGQDPDHALNDVPAAALEWERQEYEDTAQCMMVAYEDVKAGRTQPANEFLEQLRVKRGFPC